MQSLILTICLLLPMCCYLAAFWRSRADPVDRSGTSRWIWLTALVAPPTLVCLVLMLSHERFGNVIVSADGMQFSFFDVNLDGARIGGSSAQDDLVVRGLPAGFLKVESADGRAIALYRRIDSEPSGGEDGNTVGLVRVLRDGEEHNGPNATILATGYPFTAAKDLTGRKTSQLTVAGQKFELQATGDGVRFTGPGGAATELPSRTNTVLEVSFRIRRQNGPEIEIFPLQNLLRQINANLPDETIDATRSFLFRAASPLAESWLSAGGWFKDGLYLAMLDPHVSVEAGQQALTSETAVSDEIHTDSEGQRYAMLAELQPGNSLRLELFRVDYFRSQERTIRRSRVQIRRSLTVRAETGRSVSFHFDTPYTVRLEKRDLVDTRHGGASSSQQFPSPGFTIVGSSSVSGHYIPPEAAVLRFPIVGGDLSRSLFGQLRFEPPEPRAWLATEQTVLSPLEYGNSHWIGEEARLQLQIDAQVFPVGVLIMVIGVLFVQIWLVRSEEATTGSVRCEPVAGATLLLLESLLAYRLLIGIAGTNLDPENAVQFWYLLPVYACIPFLFERILTLTSRPPGSSDQRVAWLFRSTFAGVLLSGFGAYGAYAMGRIDLGITLVGAVVIGVLLPLIAWAIAHLLLYLVNWLRRPARLHPATAGAMPTPPDPAATKPGPGRRLLRWFSPRWFWPALFYLLIVVGFLRLGALLLFGVKERIYLFGGLQIAVSALTIPLLLITVALTLHAGRRAVRRLTGVFRCLFVRPLPCIRRKLGRSSRCADTPRQLDAVIWPWRMLFSILAFGFLGLALPVLASDSGLAVIMLIAFVILIAMLGAARWPLAEGTIRHVFRAGSGATRPHILHRANAWLDRWPVYIRPAYLPLISVALLTIWFASAERLPLTNSIASWMFSTPTFGRELDDPDSLSDDAAIAFIADQVETHTNQLRLWEPLAPERLQWVGTKSAEELLIVAQTMKSLSASGPLGQGFLAQRLPPVLRSTQTTDNVPAVHILGPFGQLGAVALIVAVTVWVAIISLSAQRLSASFGGRLPGEKGLAGAGRRRAAILSTVAVFAALIVLTTDAYMILANMGYLPFTGKNVYLLAALSKSDLLEGVILLLMAAWPVGYLLRERQAAAE